jgi:hypothetical protein
MPLIFCAAAAVAGEKQIVLTEKLGRPWHRQLVSEPFEAPPGACQADSVRLTGPAGLQPVQLTEVRLYEKSRFVQTATAWFIVDELAPLGTNTYTLSYDKTADATAALHSTLKVKAGPDQAELSTDEIGLRVELGEREFDKPVELEKTPSLFKAIRLGGPWSGEGRLRGAGKVRNWSATLVERGPVFAAVKTRYLLDDGTALRLTARVAAGDTAVRWEMETNGDRPDLAAVFTLPPWPGITQALLPKGYGQWAKADRVASVVDSTNPVCFLSPNTSIANIFPDCASEIWLTGSAGALLRLQTHEPGVWVREKDGSPMKPLSYGGFDSWHLSIMLPMWEKWKRCRIPFSYEGGAPILRAPLTSGLRVWSVGLGTNQLASALADVRKMVLDWPAAANDPHPRLFVDWQEVTERWPAFTNEIVAAWTNRGKPNLGLYGAGAAYQARLDPASRPKNGADPIPLIQLREQLALMGNFDVMRKAIGTAALYDALIDSDLIAPSEKPVLRARMAYLGYTMADPMCWSMERGYISGNPNMSVSYTLSLGIIACALRDHPMAPAWARQATAWMNKWLHDEVGPNGEWIPEGSHYGFVSLEPMLVYAVAAKRAGFADFSEDPRLKKLVLAFAKYQTPPDPQREGFRVSAAHGRGTSGERSAAFGLMARFYEKADPALSRLLQWMWIQNGYTLRLSDARLGGNEAFYLDKRLPAEAPAWGSELFPNLGAVLRHGFNTTSESYVNTLAFVQSTRNLDVWTPQVGALAQWYARGKPLGGNFTFELGYDTHHDLLKNGVRLPHPWAVEGKAGPPFGYYSETRFGAFAALPRADYVRSTVVYTNADTRAGWPANLPPFPKETAVAEPRLEWTRQLLFLKDADPAGAAYLVLRDTTAGGQPTVWQFWTLSDKIGAAAEAADLGAFLADKPGSTNRPARALPAGDRYTAAGWFGVDAEFFVASPAGTPRHTLRYGGVTQKREEYMDLLHLQQPGDGAYYVAVFPRPRGEKPPGFSTAGEGRIIRVERAEGIDYALLSADPVEASSDDVTLSGTAASVQRKGAGAVLSLGAEGVARWKEYGLKSPVAASLAVLAEGLVVSFPPDSPGGTVVVRAPPGYGMSAPPDGVAMKAGGGDYELTVPAGSKPVILKK